MKNYYSVNMPYSCASPAYEEQEKQIMISRRDVDRPDVDKPLGQQIQD